MIDDTDQPDPEPATPQDPTPRKFTYQTAAKWKLTGDAGSKNLDLLVCFCVSIGLAVTHIRPGSYRVWGPVEALGKVVEWVDHYKPAGPLSFNVEQPPERLSLKFEVTPDREPVRFAEVHGQDGSERLVARAIDAGLTLSCIGVGHFKVTGQTRKHVAWLMATLGVPAARALELLGLTAEQAAAEDAAAPMPAINVVLPVRETASVIQRDHRGDITRLVQTERTVR